MNYRSVCSRLEELMVELMDRGVAIPQLVIEDLSAGRTLVNVFKTEPDELDAAFETSPYLSKVEMSLLSLADAAFGKAYSDEWSNRIARAYQEPAAKESSARPAYTSGIPKGEYWVRLKTADLTVGEQQLVTLLAQFGLSAQVQEGALLVHGRKEDVSALIKEVRRITLENLEKSKNP